MWPLSQDDDLDCISDQDHSIDECQWREDIQSEEAKEFVVDTLLIVRLKSREPDHHTDNRSSDDPYIAIDFTMDHHIEEIFDRCDTRSDTSPEDHRTQSCDD
mgnify:CR=1 FL=1